VSALALRTNLGVIFFAENGDGPVFAWSRYPVLRHEWVCTTDLARRNTLARSGAITKAALRGLDRGSAGRRARRDHPHGVKMKAK
jgi:hypothetical protein